MDATLRQIIAEIFVCHREIEDLRRQVARLEALAAEFGELRQRNAESEAGEPETGGKL